MMCGAENGLYSEPEAMDGVNWVNFQHNGNHLCWEEASGGWFFETIAPRQLCNYQDCIGRTYIHSPLTEECFWCDTVQWESFQHNDRILQFHNSTGALFWN